MIGREKPERTMTTDEKEECLIMKLVFNGTTIKRMSTSSKASIVPRGEAALGFSQQKNVNKKLYNEHAILSKIAVLLGGRVAEKLIYTNVSTGAADDMKKHPNLFIKIYAMGNE